MFLDFILEYLNSVRRPATQKFKKFSRLLALFLLFEKLRLCSKFVLRLSSSIKICRIWSTISHRTPYWTTEIIKLSFWDSDDLFAIPTSLKQNFKKCPRLCSHCCVFKFKREYCLIPHKGTVCNQILLKCFFPHSDDLDYFSQSTMGSTGFNLLTYCSLFNNYQRQNILKEVVST